MKLTSQLAAMAGVVAATLSLGSKPVHAQAMTGRDIGQNRVHVAYYKVPPGRQDEWLALYKKYHKPIVDLQIRRGVTISSTLYVPKFHEGEKAWDFEIISVSPPDGQAPKLGMTRAEVIRKLFPDIEEYVRGERQRWALTLVCQEGDLVEVDLSRDPVSLYYPLDAPEKKK
jgi:hypothetical protein